VDKSVVSALELLIHKKPTIASQLVLLVKLPIIWIHFFAGKEMNPVRAMKKTFREI